jgi:hypothetical protein
MQNASAGETASDPLPNLPSFIALPQASATLGTGVFLATELGAALQLRLGAWAFGLQAMTTASVDQGFMNGSTLSGGAPSTGGATSAGDTMATGGYTGTSTSPCGGRTVVSHATRCFE